MSSFYTAAQLNDLNRVLENFVTKNNGVIRALQDAKRIKFGQDIYNCEQPLRLDVDDNTGFTYGPYTPVISGEYGTAETAVFEYFAMACSQERNTFKIDLINASPNRRFDYALELMNDLKDRWNRFLLRQILRGTGTSIQTGEGQSPKGILYYGGTEAGVGPDSWATTTIGGIVQATHSNYQTHLVAGDEGPNGDPVQDWDWLIDMAIQAGTVRNDGSIAVKPTIGFIGTTNFNILRRLGAARNTNWTEFDKLGGRRVSIVVANDYIDCAGLKLYPNEDMDDLQTAVFFNPNAFELRCKDKSLGQLEQHVDIFTMEKPVTLVWKLKGNLVVTDPRSVVYLTDFDLSSVEG